MLKMPASFASLNLDVAGAAGELHGAKRVHRDAGGADRMALRLQPAGRIDRQLAVLLRPAFLDRARALPFRRQPHRLVFDQLGDGEAVMGLDQRQVAERNPGVGQRALPGLGAAFELEDVALATSAGNPAHGRSARNATALSSCSAVSTSASTSAAAPSETSEQSVRLSGPGDERILVAGVAAEVIAEVLAHLRVGIADAVLVVLGRDQGQRVGLVAPALEIERGDLAENAGEAALDVGLLAHVGSFQQIFSDLRAGRRRHLLDADHEHDARRAGRNRLQSLMDRGRTGGAGVLDAQRALEAQVRRRLQHQRGGEILRRKAGVEVAEHDLVDVVGANAGVGQRADWPPARSGSRPSRHRACRRAYGPSQRCSLSWRPPLPNFGRFRLRFTTSEAG